MPYLKMVALQRLFRAIIIKPKTQMIKLTSETIKSRNIPGQIALFAIGALTVYTIFASKSDITQSVEAAGHEKKNPKRPRKKPVQLTNREQRFIRFASAEFDSQIYMTPNDFLESIIETHTRPRLNRKVLTQKNLEDMAQKALSLRHGSTKLFRDLEDTGIISCTEYLFLRSVLTRPESGFKIAFNMLDTNQNGEIDKTEYLIMENIFSDAWKAKQSMIGDHPDGSPLQQHHFVDTTLIVYFFGQTGNDKIDFERFLRFMRNLQAEILELEFDEFAHGSTSLSIKDFAKMLLRYTKLSETDYNRYIDRLKKCQHDASDITIEDFHVFYDFLNNMEDFSSATRMFIKAGQVISEEEFNRAVKICTGYALSPNIVHTIFCLFDEDGDGFIRYNEFVAIMKDRIHRTSKSTTKIESWKQFTSCVHHEMKFRKLLAK